MKIRKLLNSLLDAYSRYRTGRNLKRRMVSNIKRNGWKNNSAPGESEWMRRWRELSKDIHPCYYRLFSRYLDTASCIIPENIGIFVIERFLNPRRYRDFYSDKNLYQQYMRIDEYLPKTYIRRISGGVLLDAAYNALERGSGLFDDKWLDSYLSSAPDLILKPSVDTDSGFGVVKFFKTDAGYRDSKGAPLTVNYLKNFGNDFILQEAVAQHSFFSNLCKTSVNTMRLCTYRSVKTEEIIVTGGVVRIGCEGSFVDNAHAGGRFVGINVEDGFLKKTTYDQYGTSQNIWNGVDYSKENLKIPFFSNIKAAACDVARQNRHCRLLALDLTLTQEGKPILIEENVGGFSYWLLEYTNQDPLAGHLDEVFDYCLSKKEKGAC